AVDEGPWPKLNHAERAEYLRAVADALRSRAADFGQIWPRESGVIHAVSDAFAADFAGVFDYYDDLSRSFAFEEPMPTSIGGFGLLVREPVVVVGGFVQ